MCSGTHAQSVSEYIKKSVRSDIRTRVLDDAKREGVTY